MTPPDAAAGNVLLKQQSVGVNEEVLLELVFPSPPPGPSLSFIAVYHVAESHLTS